MRRGIVMVCLSSVAYGFMPLFTTACYRMGLDVVSTTFWRFSLVVPMLLLLGKGFHVDMRLRPRYAARLCVRVGIPSGLTMFLLNIAYASIDVGLATTIHFLYPVTVVILASLVYHDHITPSVRWAIALIVLGMLVLSGGISLRGDGMGVLCAAASALSYAVYLLQLDHGGFSGLSPVVTALCTAATNSVLMLLVSCFVAPIQVPGTVSQMCATIGLSGLSLLALYCLAAGTRVLMSHYVAVFGLLEPVASVACGAVFLGEEINATKLAGMLIVAVAIVLVALEGRISQAGRVHACNGNSPDIRTSC